MNADELYIARITVDGGPGGRFTKRLDPRAQGRAYFQAQAPLARDGRRERDSRRPSRASARPGASVQAADDASRAAAAARRAAQEGGARKQRAKLRKNRGGRSGS